MRKRTRPFRGSRPALRRLPALTAILLLCAAWLHPALSAPLSTGAPGAFAPSERELQPRLLDQSTALISQGATLGEPDAIASGPDAWSPPLTLALGAGCVARAPGEPPAAPPSAPPERRRAATGPPAPNA